jgi:hypothetical protein
MITIDQLRPDVITPEVRAGVDRYRTSLAFHHAALRHLEEARDALVTAAHDLDPQGTTEAAAAVREAELVAESCPTPEFDGDAVAAIRLSIERVLRRYGPEVGEPNRREFIEARARLAQPWNLFGANFRSWARTGTPASTGLELLAEASEWANRLDAYLMDHPIPPRPEDNLVHAVPRPERTFIDLSNR